MLFMHSRLYVSDIYAYKESMILKRFDLFFHPCFVEQLMTLIAAAKEHGIEFIYAISPGLDITFSNQKEVSALKRKLDQVCNILLMLYFP